MMNYNCKIIDDLLPLYADGICSEESKAAVEAHLASCKECQEKLQRMKMETFTVEREQASKEEVMKKYAKKVKQHRTKLCIGAIVLIAVLAAVLSLLFLTIKDMHNYANPSIHEVEQGTYNLTLNPLTIPASDLENYIFFTNNTRIEVSVDKDASYFGEIFLCNADEAHKSVTIGCGEITPESRSVTFSNLSSSDRYMLRCDGAEEMILTITDGRNVGFFGSMRNVLEELFTMAWG